MLIVLINKIFKLSLKFLVLSLSDVAREAGGEKDGERGRERKGGRERERGRERGRKRDGIVYLRRTGGAAHGHI